MFRWFVRFTAAALVGGLLVWFWNRYNEDLVEEELDEEIPLEFDVTAQDVLAPGMLDGNEAMDEPASTTATAPEMAPPEPTTPEETPAEETQTADTASTPSPEAAAEVVTAEETPAKTPADDPAPAEATTNADSTADAAEIPADDAASAEAASDADNSTNAQELLLDSSSPTPEGAGDNVIAIKGIGPKYSEKLAELGITTFGALLGTPIETLAVAFPRVTEAELQNWLEQARELADQSSEPA